MTLTRHAALIAVLAPALTLLPLPIPAHAGKTADAIVAGLIGAAVVAAASKHHRHERKFYYDDYESPYAPGGYQAHWNNMFKPKGDVICYRAQQACYNLNGSFNAKWTMRAFADGE